MNYNTYRFPVGSRSGFSWPNLMTLNNLSIGAASYEYGAE